MGIQFSKLVEDNISKGKQPIQNSLLNFVARSRTILPEEVVTTIPNVTELERETLEPSAKTVEKEKGYIKETEQRSSFFELPSASQIDSAVFNELPDDLKNDIIQEYQRKGITLSGINSFATNPSTSAGTSKTEAVNVSSLQVPTSNSAGTSRLKDPVSYDGIEEVTDIDASYWSALPEDIKTEIERDIQQRKTEATSPIKGWKNIFKPQRSPIKATAKLGNGKIKAEVKRKTKVHVTSKAKIQPTIRAPNAVLEEVTFSFFSLQQANR
jgi:DNA-binding transcriptional regulator YdaS (Cro superfamily)